MKEGSCEERPARTIVIRKFTCNRPLQNILGLWASHEICFSYPKNIMNDSVDVIQETVLVE
jgi:hypothetical protein